MNSVQWSLAQYKEGLAAMPTAERAEILKAALLATENTRWVPNPGPQTVAYFSPADEIFYGGQAGGGKTDLALGLAISEHKRSLVLRRTNKEAEGLVSRLEDIFGSRDGWNGQSGTWRIGDKTVEIGGCQLEEDKQKRKGIPHDLYAFDEISDFAESQYTFITGWNRSADPKQRCRVLATGNPPTRPEGLWVVRRWGAWLDPQHPNPAQPGEIRWYTTGPDGKEIEVPGRGPHMVDGQEVYARSRTFIPSKLSDNPDLSAGGYAAVLAALPPELRAAYRDGSFSTMMSDHAYQAIPTAWVYAAQDRWTPQPPVGAPMSCIGVDVAQGGADNTVLAVRFLSWYDKLIVVPGMDTPDGKAVAGLVVKNRRERAKVVVDIGGGWGGDAHAHMRENGIDSVSYMGIKASSQRTVDGLLTFSNVRTEAYWRLREALDPSQVGGSKVMLPKDTTMVADLCAPRFSLTSRGLVLEAKTEVVKRLGRSPDRGDAVVMAWHAGLHSANFKNGMWVGEFQYPDTADTGRLNRRVRNGRR